MWNGVANAQSAGGTLLYLHQTMLQIETRHRYAYVGTLASRKLAAVLSTQDASAKRPSISATPSPLGAAAPTAAVAAAHPFSRPHTPDSPHNGAVPVAKGSTRSEHCPRVLAPFAMVDPSAVPSPP